MFRTPIDLAYVKRPLKERYGTNAVAFDTLLDPDWDRSIDLFPGMAVRLTSSDNTLADDFVQVVDTANEVVFGLLGLYVAPAFGIDEVRDQGINAVPVWQLNPGVEYEVNSESFVTGATWTSTPGTPLYVAAVVSGANQGKLTPHVADTTTAAFARLVSKDANTIIITGLQGTV